MYIQGIQGGGIARMGGEKGMITIKMEGNKTTKIATLLGIAKN